MTENLLWRDLLGRLRLVTDMVLLKKYIYIKKKRNYSATNYIFVCIKYNQIQITSHIYFD